MANSFFEITGGTAPGTAGTAMVGLDLNGDGTDDTVVATSDVTVIYGDLDGFDPEVDISNLPAAAGFTLEGSALGDEFGYVLAKATDLQGAGTGDALLIGARKAGTVSVVLNGETAVGFTVTGLTSAADGMSLTALGDFNGDGFGDFAIGDPSANSGRGAVYVIFGSETPPATLDVDDLVGTNGFVINGFEENDLAGTSIAGGFDLNSDGINDLLIGAPGTDVGDTGGTNAGAAYIVYGDSSTPPATEDINAGQYTKLAFTGYQFDEFGTVVSTGDVNGDSYGDIIVLAPEADTSSSAAYVILGANDPQTDLAALSGSASGGFKITGVDIADVTMLGDVSGDGVGDIGIVASNGDVYIVYGQQGGFTGGTFDLNTMTDPSNQPNNLGMVFKGLFGDTVPTSVTLTGLGDVNGDPSGAIGDIGIYATFAGGTQPAQSFTILGGTANFAALDAADNSDGTTDSTIDFAAIDGPVDFVETAPTVVFIGDAAVTIDEDTANVSGTIGITDSATDDPVQFVRNDPIQGIYGMFVLNDAGNLWTYTVDADQVAILNALDADESVEDFAIFVANNPAQTQRKITITIDGVDDIATVEVLLDGPATEDNGRITGTVTLDDPDTSDNPTLAGTSGTGTYGNIVVDENGRFAYTVTDASLQSLGDNETREETITLTGDDGLSYDFVLEITGAAEETPLNFFGDTNDTIYTSFGNDIINAFGGNDFINAGAGNDTVDAGNGDDTVFDVLGDDSVDGGIGNDDIRLLTGDNIVEGGDGNDFIVTGFGFDTINGGAGNDVIAADAGGVFLFGNNQITGGAGSDYMMGGAGRDTFVFNQIEAADGDIDTIGAFSLDGVTRTDGDLDVIQTGASFQFGVDQIVLLGFATVNANNVMEFVTTQDGTSRFEAEGTVIDFLNIQITPEDSTAGLQASDFLFALA